ncbi:MAG TPA: rod shape-determining protein RodA [Candidatus Acidoferrales bacterium]
MKQSASIRDYDGWLLAIVFSICGIGLLEIWSATHTGPLAGMHWRQLWWILLGVAAMLVVSRLDYHIVLHRAPILYVLGIFGLIAVLAVGHTRFGARRWLPVLGQFLQVSELVKLVIILLLARFYAEVRTDRLSVGDLLKVGSLTALPLGLILMQPDLGSALVLVPAVVVGAYLAGIEWKHAAVLVLAGAMMLPIGWQFLRPYQKERVTTFLRPEADPRGSGYQILQSKIAVGSGGFWGKGLGRGSQNQLGFVPVRYSDFILAALAEELGFAGVFVTLLLYTALLLRLIQNAQRAKDRAGMFLVMGVAAIVGFHVLVNVAMVIGYMPVTGIPLPLMSYGGSATLFMFLALGLVMNVRLGRFVN